MLQQVPNPKDKELKKLPADTAKIYSQPASFDGATAGTTAALGGGAAAVSHPSAATGAVGKKLKKVSVDYKPKMDINYGKLY